MNVARPRDLNAPLCSSSANRCDRPLRFARPGPDAGAAQTSRSAHVQISYCTPCACAPPQSCAGTDPPCRPFPVRSRPVPSHAPLTTFGRWVSAIGTSEIVKRARHLHVVAVLATHAQRHFLDTQHSALAHGAARRRLEAEIERPADAAQHAHAHGDRALTLCAPFSLACALASSTRLLAMVSSCI